MTATHISTMTTNAENPRIPWKLYLFVFFSYVGDRSWTFAIGLFMVQLSAREFEWPAIYGLVVSLVVVVFSPGLGRMVDRNQRWRGTIPCRIHPKLLIFQIYCYFFLKLFASL